MERHTLDSFSLIAGLVFAAIGVVVLAGVDLTTLDWRWVGPAALLVAGLLVLASGLRGREAAGSGRDGQRDDQVAPGDDESSSDRSASSDDSATFR